MDGQVERSLELYSISLPPEMILCTNVAGAARLMNRHRVSISGYVRDGRLKTFSVSGNSAVPLEDIAKLLDTTEVALYNIAIAYKLSLWQVYRQ